MKSYDTSRNIKNQDSSLLFYNHPCPNRISDGFMEIQIQPRLALDTWSEPALKLRPRQEPSGPVGDHDGEQNAFM